MDTANNSVVRLLRALVALVALLTLGIAAGAALAASEYLKIRAQLREPATTEADPMEQAFTVLEEITRRQQVMADALESQAGTLKKELAGLRQRREMLDEIPKGPVGKVDQSIRLMQLMSDQMLVLMEQLRRTEENLARAARPLPSQRELQRQGR